MKYQYQLAVGPNGNVYVHVRGKPHLIYSLAAFQQLVTDGLA